MFDITLFMKSGTFQKGGYIQRVGRGQYFFRRNDGGDEMYIVISGKVDIILAENEPPIATLGAGELFGEMTFLENMPRSASARASEDTLALVINNGNFNKLMRKNPEIALNIMKTLSGRLRVKNEHDEIEITDEE